MENQAIDGNQRGTWTAYNETTGQVERVRCDPVTNALLVYAVTADSNSPQALNTAKTDANNRPTALAYNETTGMPEALRCGTDGSLLVILAS